MKNSHTGQAHPSKQIPEQPAALCPATECLVHGISAKTDNPFNFCKIKKLQSSVLKIIFFHGFKIEF